MNSAASAQDASGWMVRNGVKERELLLRAVLSHQAEPILIADDEGNCVDVSLGACKLFGLSMSKMIGQRIDDLVETGKLHYTKKSDVLPGLQVVVLHDKSATDYAFLSTDNDGVVVAWHAGAERIYGYKSEEIVGHPVSRLYSEDNHAPEELQRAATDGHLGSEGWHQRKDGSRFWANVLTTALRGEGRAQSGLAWVVRDFSARHLAGEMLLDKRAGRLQPPAESTVAGIVSGEFDRIVEVNDAFLNMVGYSREDVIAGRLQWAEITAPEYLPPDERAHEESLLYGACTPFEKEYIRKDGTRCASWWRMRSLKLHHFDGSLLCRTSPSGSAPRRLRTKPAFLMNTRRSSAPARR